MSEFRIEIDLSPTETETPPRSEPFEAAVRAGLEAYSDDIGMREFVTAILAAALPPDPAPETIDGLLDRALSLGFNANETDITYLYHTLRASLLPGEEQ